jgi:CRISPR/Cas system-associated exonuclease Cas4 (RecB family)
VIKDILDLDLLFENLDRKSNLLDAQRVPDGKFHPSSFGSCERKLYYAYHKTQAKAQISSGLRRTFDHGHVVHSWIQKKLVKIAEGLPFLTEDDYKPGCKFTVECEVNITNTTWAKDHNVSGSADALITLTEVEGKDIGPKKVVYELKTSASKTWDSIKTPLIKHVMQANAYAAALEADLIIFDYYNKDKDVHKRFYVQPDLEIQKSISDTLYNVMLTCTSGEEVPRQISSWECDSCPYKYTCLQNE